MNQKAHHIFAVFFLIFLAISAVPVLCYLFESSKTHMRNGYDVWLLDRNILVIQPDKKVPSPYGEALPGNPLVQKPERNTESFLDLVLPGKEHFEKWANESFPFQDEFSTFNMAFRYHIGMKSPIEGERSVLLPNQRMAMFVDEPHTDEKLDLIVKIRDRCDEYGGEFLVILKPNSEGAEEYVKIYTGLVSDYNHELQVWADQLRKKNIDVFELQKVFLHEIPESEMDKYWYRTDHHWNIFGGLFAAKHIANRLNQNSGTAYDLQYFDPETFVQYNFRDSIIGSIGKKFSAVYSEGKKEDFIILLPAYHTSFTLEYDVDVEGGIAGAQKVEPHWQRTVEHGDFTNLLKTKWFSYDAYHTWAYSCFFGGDFPFIRIKNNKIKEGKKILWIKDSFSNVVIPYMALQTKEIIVVDPRTKKYEEILQIIKDEKPDIVISMYFYGI